MGLVGEEISESTNLELKVSSFDKTKRLIISLFYQTKIPLTLINICCVFPCKMSFCDISDVTNVESEPASNNALVLMDLDPFEKMTGIICKCVLG